MCSSDLPGQYVRYADETPLANLFVGMSNVMGVEANAFGDSTGRIELAAS